MSAPRSERTRRPIASSALAAAVAALCACASTPESQSRDLPPGLNPLSELLEGCAPDTTDPDVQRVRCAGDVMFASRVHPDGTEPRYRFEANELASELGAQLVWDQTVVPTEAESGLVDRGRALMPLNETASATMFGALHGRQNEHQEEVWCTARDAEGDERCRELLGAALSRTSASTTASTMPTARSPRGPASFLGRSLSLPTTCAVETASKAAGVVRCENGVVLTWSAHGAMDEAVQALNARLAAMGDDADGETFDCAIAGEVAQCERRKQSIAGVTYVNGTAVAVTCIGPGELINDGGCRAVFLPR